MGCLPSLPTSYHCFGEPCLAVMQMTRAPKGKCLIVGLLSVSSLDMTSSLPSSAGSRADTHQCEFRCKEQDVTPLGRRHLWADALGQAALGQTPKEASAITLFIPIPGACALA
eukprot:1147255-Pelagomonas_calceolata.AAC.3